MPVVLIASQITRDEIGFEFPQEVDFKSVYAGSTVFCEELRTPVNARRRRQRPWSSAAWRS